MLARIMRHMPGGIIIMVMPMFVIMMMRVLLFFPMMRVLVMKVRLRRQMHGEKVQVKRGQRHCAPAARAPAPLRPLGPAFHRLIQPAYSSAVNGGA